MGYELTRAGEEYFDKLPIKLGVAYEKFKASGASHSSSYRKMTTRVFLLGRIRRGEEPVEDSFPSPKGTGGKRVALRGSRRIEGWKAPLRKELLSMLKAGLIKEAPKMSASQMRDLYANE